MASSILPIFERHPHWPKVIQVIQTLEGAGFKAVLAGGCVRDALLRRPLHDFDIATSATPDQVEALFTKTVAIGKAFGVMMVVQGRVSFEVATFRRDGEYQDGRHPEGVEFSSLEEDAKRRDFTVNALFYRLASDEIIDVVGGQEDLSLKIIRAVGDAQARLTEDRLRILRAVRFAAQLGFVVESETWNATVQLSSSLGAVAKERQVEELRRLAVVKVPAYGWELLRRSQLLKNLLPELDQAILEQPSQWQVALMNLSLCKALDLASTLAWFALMMGLGSERPAAWLKNLKASVKEVQWAQSVVSDMLQLCSGDLRLGERLQLLDREWGPLLIQLWPIVARERGILDVGSINQTVERFRELMDSKGHLPNPLVDGHDLEKLGLEPGPQFGRWLNKVYNWQLEGQSDKECLLQDLQRELKLDY